MDGQATLINASGADAMGLDEAANDLDEGVDEGLEVLLRHSFLLSLTGNENELTRPTR